MGHYKNIDLDERLAAVIRHMNSVEEYREILQNLQSTWDNLTLLGQLSGIGADMSGTRQAFQQLSSDLLVQLAEETLRKTVLEMGSKAQVAIDILVRNLFERTADIGFLATDADISSFIALSEKAAGPSGEVPAGDEEFRKIQQILRQRFSEYVAKYSVYSDIILLDTSGQVLARLDETIMVSRSADPLVERALKTREAYIENYGELDLLPGQGAALVYAYRVTDGSGQAIGVLCLSFRFQDEMERIFADLNSPDDWSVVLLLDEKGKVLASSDGYHLPVGATVERVLSSACEIVRFGAQEYLAITRHAAGYQGYMGPGWHGHVMLPVHHAFNKDVSAVLKGLDGSALAEVMNSASLFGDALRSIPKKAEHIQRDLNRSVWNGNVRQSGGKKASNPSFAKILLWEISNTGARTKEVFERSIANLHETVVSSILQECQFLASLAIDIMDRNLYERANDCRWWALTSTFRELLEKESVTQGGQALMSSILETINGLYTVYTNLIVFDSQGRVVAVSQPTESALVGETIEEEWIPQVLNIKDSQGYTVSDFSLTPLYANRFTYIYGAAIFSLKGKGSVGGVGIVFDSEPQFAAMLRDSLPRDTSGKIRDGCFGVFIDELGQVIACSDERYKPGDSLGIDLTCLPKNMGDATSHVVRLGGHYFAMGARMSAGYREYKGEHDSYRNKVLALVFIRLCEAENEKSNQTLAPLAIRSDHSVEGQTLEIATFRVGNRWFGLRTSQVVEAVEMCDMAAAPGSGKEFVGYMIYDGLPVPVYDINVLSGDEETQADARQIVVILKKNETDYFGIVVDGLGGIPEINLSRLKPIPHLVAGESSLGEALLATESEREDGLLIVLGVNRIAERLAELIAVAKEKN